MNCAEWRPASARYYSRPWPANGAGTPQSGLIRDQACPVSALVLQPGLRWSSSFPMAFPGSLLVAAAPVRPGVCGLVVRWPGPDQMPQQAAHLGHGERQQIGFEIDHAFFPRPRRSGARRDRHAPASPA